MGNLCFPYSQSNGRLLTHNRPHTMLGDFRWCERGDRVSVAPKAQRDGVHVPHKVLANFMSLNVNYRLPKISENKYNQDPGCGQDPIKC